MIGLIIALFIISIATSVLSVCYMLTNGINKISVLIFSMPVFIILFLKLCYIETITKQELVEVYISKGIPFIIVEDKIIQIKLKKELPEDKMIEKTIYITRYKLLGEYESKHYKDIDICQ